MFFLKCISIATMLLMLGCKKTIRYKLSDFNVDKESERCYDRSQDDHISIVDSHVHFRPFGGEAIPFDEVVEYLDKAGVLFANVYGIGQILPTNSSCTYYLDCPGVLVKPSTKNDFVNATNYLKFKPKNVHLVLSITSLDLANPQNSIELINSYDKKYPGIFKWAGEVNLVKQALLNNGHIFATKEDIRQWASFMKILRDRNMPITIHSDLGNNIKPTKFLYLMEYVLRKYPQNNIVWAHMGLSKELTNISAQEHIQIMGAMLNKYKNLMLDVSWRILEDNHYGRLDNRKQYVEFFNKYSNRILPGTDFVASDSKDFKIYEEELKVSNKIMKNLDDEAFGNIVLGKNYFRLLGLDYKIPEICQLDNAQ